MEGSEPFSTLSMSEKSFWWDLNHFTTHYSPEILVIRYVLLHSQVYTYYVVIMGSYCANNI